MVRKILSYVVLPLCIIGLVYLIVASVMQPVNFNKEKSAREQVGIQRLKDIRTLQVAYKTEKGVFTESIDTLKDFYNNGEIKIVMSIGSKDDSLAYDINTKNLQKKYPKITDAEMFEISGMTASDITKKYSKVTAAEAESIVKGGLVFSIETMIPVRDTLFKSRTDFNVNDLAYIPFSNDPIIMDATVRRVSGVDVPLFEADMPYNSLLVGMNRQLIVNLNAEREDLGRYKGLQVGSIEAPNNNAGNWE